MSPKPAANILDALDIIYPRPKAMDTVVVVRDGRRPPEADMSLPIGMQSESIDYAPPKARLPGYVEHRDGVGEIGKLSAEAVIKEYENAAVAVETMGSELKDRIAKLEATKTEAVAALAEIKETAERYRDEGKRIFLQIEDCSLMTSEVRATCGALKNKIAGPSS